MATIQPPAAAPDAQASKPVPSATVTIFSNSRGRPLSKSVILDTEGNPVITPSAQLAEGTFRVEPASTVTELARVLSALTPQDALAHGVPKSGALKGRVVSAAKLGANPGAITRSLEFFGWGAGPGWVMCDMDLKDLPPKIAVDLDLSSVEALGNILVEVVPELRGVPMLGLPSASAMLYRTGDGKLLRGLTGARFYLPVQHAQHIPALGQLLFDRLVLAGPGYAFVSKSGRILPRTLIDSAVYSPERLDFIGGADCGAGVEQRRGEPIIWNADSKVWFSLDELDGAARERLASITAAIVAAARPEAAATRTAYVQGRAAAGHPIAATESEGGLIALAPEHAIELADGTWITVSDILANPEKCHGQYCSDPMEPEYAPRANHVAKIFAVGQRSGPVINSLAHGGLKYVLDRGGPVPAAEADFEALDDAPEAPPTVVALPSEGERLAALTRDADAAFLAEQATIRGDLLERWDTLHAASEHSDPLADVFASVVWPVAEGASSRSEAAFRFSIMHRLAGEPRWKALSDSDRQLLLRAARLLLKKGTSEIRVPRLIEEASPREWLIENFLPAGSVVALIGPTNQGKTFASLSIACLVGSAEGSATTFDGRAVKKRGPVFYFTSEDPQGLAHRREAWEKANVLAPGLHLFDDVPLLTGPLGDSVLFLRSAAKQAACTPALLVIDVFTDSVIGDDNSAEVIAPAMRQARVLGRMFGASVLLVHHSNKADPKDARGSSAFGNATDVTLAVIAEGRDICMSWVKARSTPKGSNFYFHLRDGVLYNGRSAQGGESGASSEGEILARVAGHVLREIHTPATQADWNAAIAQALPSYFSEKVTPAHKRMKLLRCRKVALDRQYAAGDKNKGFCIGPVVVPEDAMEPGNIDHLTALEALDPALTAAETLI